MVIGALLAGLLMAGCGSDGDAAGTAADGSANATSMTTVRFAQSGAIFQLSIHALLRQERFAAEQGVEIEVTQTRAPKDVLQALAAGAADVGMTVPDTAVLAQMQGVPIKVVYGVLSGVPYSIIAEPSVKSVEDLRGKKLSVVQEKAAVTTMAAVALEKAGLPPDAYDVIASGDPASRIAALQSGAVAATFLPPPVSFLLESRGMNNILSISDHVKTPSIVLIAREEWAKDNPDALVGFLTALNNATEWVYDPKNEDEVIAALEASQGLEVTPEALQKSYDMLVGGEFFPRDGSVELESTIELMLDAGLLDERVEPAQFLDLTYQEQAAGT